MKFNGRWLNSRKLVQGALDRLNEVFRVDFGKDEDLMAGLKMHFRGLVERTKNKVVLEDIFLEEIKEKYPLIFEMGVYVVAILRKCWKCRCPRWRAVLLRCIWARPAKG